MSTQIAADSDKTAHNSLANLAAKTESSSRPSSASNKNAPVPGSNSRPTSAAKDTRVSVAKAPAVSARPSAIAPAKAPSARPSAIAKTTTVE
ncbi:hypothetical protein HDU83_003350 [Entophlyctis luteolus]|nr:hypothetical protein HDU83_003350 [Entophlyctis luteolus]